MIKRSSSRNQRSRGIKVKHVLQIIVLVGVCFWLIYQVKRSHDKKQEFDESDSKMSVRTQTAYQIPKLGRKDLHPDKDKVIQNEKHEEEEDEDENIVEDEDKSEHNEHKEGNVHETEEKKYDKHGARAGKEQEETKSEEMEDERGGGDDENEIDEDDQEKPEVDTDRDEEIVNEEKEKEEEEDEKEKEKSEGEVKLRSVENHNSHEAREENYRGDDASSAVTHDTKTTSTETEMVNLEISDVNSEMGITKSENKPNGTEDSITMRNQPSLDFNITEVKLTGETYSNATSGIEARNSSLSNQVDSSLINNTALTYSDGHSQTSSNLTVMFSGASNNMTGVDTSSEHNKTTMFSDQAQNNTVNSTVTGDVKNVQTEGLEQGGNAFSEESLGGSNLTVLVKTENGAAAGGESSNLEGGDIEKPRFVASNENENTGNNEMSETHKTQNSSFVKDNTDATKDEESKGKTSDTPDSSSANGTSDSVEQHATDSYDSHTLLKDITEVQTDLDTLPVIKNEGDNNGATATD